MSLAPKAEPQEAAIIFHDLTLGYERHPAVHHISGTVPKGELLALVGPNGAGKSTLLKGIMGQLQPLSGWMSLDGFTRHDVAYLPQQMEIDRSFPISVFDFASMGLWREAGIWSGIGRAGNARVREALRTVGLEDFERRTIGTLSGGQFQRMLFARLVLQDAHLILLDEPFRAVDEATMADLLGLVRGWHHEGRTVIAALHDIDQVRANFPATLLLAREVVAWGKTADVLTPRNLSESRRLCAAWDEHAEVCERA
jgi:zinc/manganese transport system ATP-binding protein